MNADDSNEHLFHVGSTIAGRYLVERPIGEGAMGAVALARHVSLDETVAIKFLRPELRRDPVANARLSREARALARIKSDHVARVLDVGATLSVGPYMVMEYLEGTDLGEVLENEGPLPVARAVECVLQVCEALTVAHTAGITHRDIKPQNLFLARHGQFETLKVLDFGIADVAPTGAMPAEPLPEAGLPSAERAGAAPVYGTPPYMAPERVRNDPSADHRSDIWSVGVVLHELVTGRGVFDAATITETCARIVADAPIDIEANDAVLPPSLRTIIARCLMRDPAARYQSVEELAAALAPLATMHERFRGRSTGAFSRSLLEEQLALQSQNARPSSLSPADRRARGASSVAHGAAVHGAAAGGGAGFDGVLEALRGWVVHTRPSAWLRARGIGDGAAVKYVALAAASLLLAAMAASVAGGVSWMTPPPSSSVPIRAEVTPPVERVPRAVVEGVQSLVAEPSLAPSPAAVSPTSAGEANVVKDRPALPTPSRAAASPTRERRERQTAPRSRNPAPEADAEDSSRSAEARSRVRLVKERLVTNQPTKRVDEDAPSAATTPEAKADAEAAKKDRAKKARPLPTWLQPFQPKKQDGKAPSQ
jgi:eukaryotic-like serine/threonine-protein kinase